MNKSKAIQVPSFDELMLPTIKVLQSLGGSGTNEEILNEVLEMLKLPESALEVPHGDSSLSEVEYRLHWSRTYLKKYGIIENSARGVWAIAQSATDLERLDPKSIVKAVREMDRRAKASKVIASEDTAVSEDGADDTAAGLAWQEKLHGLLMSLDPAAFERLVQRLLRESGFIQVEVTGRSGDGGIDGIGIARVASFLSFHVIFQCKRYTGAITPSQVRDFRGAMQGRTDKGLFVTTGTFTRDAIKEATRDGAPPIDLIDGEQLVLRLKELGLGVRIQMVESVEVDDHWFSKI